MGGVITRDDVERAAQEERDFDPEGFWRVKGARDLPPLGRAILRELYQWREGVAMVRRWTDEFLNESQFTSHGISPAPPPATTPARDDAAEHRAPVRAQ